MEYNGKNPNGINQLSQSLLSIDVNGTEEVRIHPDKVILNNKLDVSESIYSPQITGSAIKSTQLTSVPTNLVQLTIGTVVNYSSYTTADISISKIYNRALSASEVLQNFNATKGRYL